MQPEPPVLRFYTRVSFTKWLIDNHLPGTLSSCDHHLHLVLDAAPYNRVLRHLPQLRSMLPHQQARYFVPALNPH